MSKDSSKRENKKSGVKNREDIPISQFPIRDSHRGWWRKGRTGDLGGPWSVILITLVIFIVSQFAAAFIVGIGNSLAHPNASLSDALNNSAPVQFFYVLLAEGLAAGFTIFVVRKLKKLSLATIGLGRRPRWNDATKALAGAGAFYVLLVAASILVNLLAPNINTNESQDVGFNSLNTPLDDILAFSALVFLPPLGEETLVRGYLYSGLRQHWRMLPALLVTSVLFGLAHIGSGTDGTPLWVAGIDTFLLSVVLVYLREKTGALYAGMMVHALNNVVAFGIHFHGVIF